MSAPANAAGTFECDPGTVNHQNYAICQILGAANPANSKWYYGGVYQSFCDNQTFVRFACGGTGTHFNVQATFTNADGSAGSGSASGTCGGMAT